MKISILIFIFLFNYLCALGQELENKFESALDSVFKDKPESIGIMVHVESPSSGISWSNAVGNSDKNKKYKIDPEQPALIASCTKIYVSATILRLVEQKKLNINQPIVNLISEKTRKLFESDGYDLETIKIKHLLTHTSGIKSYVDREFFDFINDNQQHKWTRYEQLELSIKKGSPLGIAGTTFHYADANYLLLTEIIEKTTSNPFYVSMRKLLDYNKLNLTNTWFPTLENKPSLTKPLVHQYWGRLNWDSYEIDNSWDLYGSGGIASTTEDLAKFSYNLFNSNVIKDKTAFQKIYTKVETKDSVQSNYFLGITQKDFKNIKGYGHEGFWGVAVFHFPELDTSISVYILEFDQRDLRHLLINKMVEILKANK